MNSELEGKYETVCPHCLKPKEPSSPYCSKCGFRIQRAIEKIPKRYPPPFPWALIPILLIIVPLAVCGSCSMFDSTLMITLPLLAGVGITSIAFGMIILFANTYEALRKRK